MSAILSRALSQPNLSFDDFSSYPPSPSPFASPRSRSVSNIEMDLALVLMSLSQTHPPEPVSRAKGLPAHPDRPTPSEPEGVSGLSSPLLPVCEQSQPQSLDSASPGCESDCMEVDRPPTESALAAVCSRPKPSLSPRPRDVPDAAPSPAPPKPLLNRRIWNPPSPTPSQDSDNDGEDDDGGDDGDIGGDDSEVLKSSLEASTVVVVAKKTRSMLGNIERAVPKVYMGQGTPGQRLASGCLGEPCKTSASWTKRTGALVHLQITRQKLLDQINTTIRGIRKLKRKATSRVSPSSRSGKRESLEALLRRRDSIKFLL